MRCIKYRVALIILTFIAHTATDPERCVVIKDITSLILYGVIVEA